MGVVYLGVAGDESPVAVKVLRPHVAGDPDARQRLAREVQTLRRVQHERIARVLVADVDAELPYVACEYVRGATLDRYIETVGPLDATALTTLAYGLGDALGAIHAAGIIHRDLKPANVMVRDGHPVVIDFGIAHVADDSRLTMTGLVMGTPGYLSPELLEGATVDRATDWWGWAATLVFAATGRAPFGRGPMEIVLDRVRRGDVDLNGVPVSFVPVLRAALAPDPAQRPRPGVLRASLLDISRGLGVTEAATATLPRATVTESRDGADPSTAPTEAVQRATVLHLARTPEEQSARVVGTGGSAPVDPAAATEAVPVGDQHRRPGANPAERVTAEQATQAFSPAATSALPLDPTRVVPAAPAPAPQPSTSVLPADHPATRVMPQPGNQPTGHGQPGIHHNQSQPHNQGYPQHQGYPPPGPGRNAVPVASVAGYRRTQTPPQGAPGHSAPGYPGAADPRGAVAQPFALRAPAQTYPGAAPQVEQPRQPRRWSRNQTPSQPPAQHPGGGPAASAQLQPRRAHQAPVPPQPAANPQAPQAPGRKSARTGTVLIAWLAFAVAFAAAPTIAAAAWLGWAVVARTVDRVGWALVVRRHAYGPRRRDAAVAVATTPLHMVAAVLLTALQLILPVLMAASVYFMVSVVAPASDVPFSGVPAMAAAGAALVLTSWWGPGGGAVRRGSRAVIRGITPGGIGSIFAVGLLLVGAAAAAALLLQNGGSGTWFPLQADPFQQIPGLRDALPSNLPPYGQP